MHGLADGIADYDDAELLAQSRADQPKTSRVAPAGPALVEAQRLMMGAALGGEGVGAVLAPAVSCMGTLLRPVACAVVVGVDGSVPAELSKRCYSAA